MSAKVGNIRKKGLRVISKTKKTDSVDKYRIKFIDVYELVELFFMNSRKRVVAKPPLGKENSSWTPSS